MSGRRDDDSPQRLDEYVSIEEIDALLEDEGRFLAKDHRRTAHFLARDVFGLQHKPLPQARIALYDRVTALKDQSPDAR